MIDQEKSHTVPERLSLPKEQLSKNLVEQAQAEREDCPLEKGSSNAEFIEPDLISKEFPLRNNLIEN